MFKDNIENSFFRKKPILGKLFQKMKFHFENSNFGKFQNLSVDFQLGWN